MPCYAMLCYTTLHARRPVTTSTRWSPRHSMSYCRRYTYLYARGWGFERGMACPNIIFDISGYYTTGPTTNFYVNFDPRCHSQRFVIAWSAPTWTLCCCVVCVVGLREPVWMACPSGGRPWRLGAEPAKSQGGKRQRLPNYLVCNIWCTICIMCIYVLYTYIYIYTHIHLSLSLYIYIYILKPFHSWLTITWRSKRSPTARSRLESQGDRISRKARFLTKYEINRIYVYVHIYTHIHVYVYIYIYMYIHTCIHTHVCIYIYIYTHSYSYCYSYSYSYATLAVASRSWPRAASSSGTWSLRGRRGWDVCMCVYIYIYIYTHTIMYIYIIHM